MHGLLQVWFSRPIIMVATSITTAAASKSAAGSRKRSRVHAKSSHSCVGVCCRVSCIGACATMITVAARTIPSDQRELLLEEHPLEAWSPGHSIQHISRHITHTHTYTNSAHIPLKSAWQLPVPVPAAQPPISTPDTRAPVTTNTRHHCVNHGRCLQHLRVWLAQCSTCCHKRSCTRADAILYINTIRLTGIVGHHCCHHTQCQCAHSVRKSAPCHHTVWSLPSHHHTYLIDVAHIRCHDQFQVGSRECLHCSSYLWGSPFQSTHNCSGTAGTGHAGEVTYSI